MLSFALFFSVVARAEPPFSACPWATCYATKRTVPIKIDGDLSEWKEVPGVTMAEEKFFFVGQGMSSAKWKGPKDLSATFKLQWDSEFLYIAVEVTDDVVTEPHGSLVSGNDTGSWDDDGVEIMLDNDGCGMPRYYIGDTLHHEMHFVYSAKHPYVFDNFWKPQPGAPMPMFKLPDGHEEPLPIPAKSWPRTTLRRVLPARLGMVNSRSVERPRVMLWKSAWHCPAPKWSPSTKGGTGSGLTWRSTTMTQAAGL